MKIEIDITKTDAEKLRTLLGLKTKTKPQLVINSLLKMLVKNPDNLEILLYEKANNTTG